MDHNIYYNTNVELSISQNFITNKDLIKKLVLAAGINSDDTVFDIGAGTGSLTIELSKAAKKVYAFEYDQSLESVLKSFTSNCPNVEVMLMDFLKYAIPQNITYKVFSNIPFSITSDIVNKLIFDKNPPVESFLFMQKEAAQRFMGVEEGTLISLLIKPFFEMKIEHEFNREDFAPKPSVDVVLLRMRKLENPLVNEQNSSEYRNFVVYALLQQKPTLKLRLNKIFTFNQFHRLAKDLKFPLDAQATDLNVSQWIGLFNYYLIGVTPEKKQLIKHAGELYVKQKHKVSGPSRTKSKVLVYRHRF